MNKKITMAICVFMTSSILASCAQKQRTETETKPKVTINAVTNATNATKATSNTSVANKQKTNAPKVTLPGNKTVAKQQTQQNNQQNNNNAYVPPQVQTPVEQTPITVPEYDDAVDTTPQTTPQTTPPTTQPTQNNQNPTTQPQQGNQNPVTQPQNNNNTGAEETDDTVADNNTGETTQTPVPDVTDPGYSTIPLDFKEKDEVTLRAEMYVYGTAADAIEGDTSKSINTYKAGTYYVYKINPDGAINVSNSPDTPGGWITNGEYLMDPPGDSQPPATTPGTTAPDRLPVGTKIVLDDTVNVYGTAADAIAKNNPVNQYEPGVYYIAKYSDGAVNISHTNDKPGAWISPEVDFSKADAPAATGTVTVIGDGTVKVEGSVPVYGTAEDAKKKVNSTYPYESGTYYIYKEVDGMLNISKEPNTPGAWINPNPGSSDSADADTDTEDASQGTESDTTENTGTTPNDYAAEGIALADGKARLTETFNLYGTAYDAQMKQNPIGTYDAGDYFLYKESDGMLNISPYEGAPGAWINPGDLIAVDRNPEESHGDTVADNTTPSGNGDKTPEGGTLVASGDGYRVIHGTGSQMPSEVMEYFMNESSEVELTYYGTAVESPAVINETYTPEEMSIEDVDTASRIADLLNTGEGWSADGYSVNMEKSGENVGAINISTGTGLDSTTQYILNEAFKNYSYPANSGSGYGSVTNEVANLMSKAASDPGTVYSSMSGTFIIKVVSDGSTTEIRIADFGV